MPVWRACHDFFDLQTAFKKGNSAGMPEVDTTTNGQNGEMQIGRVNQFDINAEDF